MNRPRRALSTEHVTAAAAILSVALSAIAVLVTLHIAYVQDRATETQNQYSRALSYAGIYFSDQVSEARDMVDAVYLADYDTIRQSASPNDEVANLLTSNREQLAFDKLLAMYEQIAACSNTGVCSSDVTGQLYGRDIQAIYKNWYGYIVTRRVRTGSADYGCHVARYLHRDFPEPKCPVK